MTRCSEASLGEPLPGTAPTRRFWWAIDHPGPWPAQPLVESVLGELASWVTPLAGRSDTTVLLTRQRDPEAPRQVYFADTWDRTLAVGPCGPTPPDLAPCPDTVTLVCTHARRDQCCAILGRPLLDVMTGARESTHIGGHRFAPTVLVLPWGIVLGRCAAEAWPPVQFLGPDALPYYRGRTALEAPAQVADAEARRIWGLGLTENLTVTRDPRTDRVRFEVSHASDHVWIEVESSQEAYLPSCGREPDSTTVWRVTGRS